MKNISINKWKTNKWLLLIASIVSILSMIPFYFFIKSMIIMFGVMDFGAMPAKEVAEILNRNIYSAAFLVPTIFIILSILVNASISAYMLNNGVKGLEKSFAISNIVFGGLGFSLFFIIPSIFLKEHNYKEGRKYKYGFAAAIIGSVLSIIISFFLSFSLKGFDSPTKVSTVGFSLDKSTPNIIEIFSDGFDPRGMGKQIAEEEKASGDKSVYRDFYGIEKFVTAGLLTNDSFPSLMGGLDSTDWKFWYESKNKKWDDTLLNYVYMNKFGPLAVKHMNSTKQYNMQKYMVNPLAMTNVSLYNKQVSGDVDYVKRLDKDIKVVNWAQAKNDNAGFMGTSKLSPDSQIYSWLNKHVSKSTKRSRVFIQDLVTHEPTVSAEDGHIMWDSSYNHPTRKYVALNNHLKQFFNSLKNVKDAHNNAFDNSLIIIYGDHNDHSRSFSDKSFGISGNRSFMIIKYPNEQKHSYTKITKREVYAPFIERIINDGIKPKTTGIDFIKNNTNFDPNRLYASWDGEDPMFFSQFDSSGKLKFVPNALGDKYKNYETKNKNRNYYNYAHDKTYIDAMVDKVGWK